MLNAIKKRFNKDQDEGFTLIELMVVVLIIAILMAIAIPTFLSARGSAQAKAAESDLQSAITDQQTYFTNTGSGTTYGADTDLTTAKVDPGITWSAMPVVLTTAGQKTVYVQLGGLTAAATPQTAVLLGTAGGDGNSYWVLDSNGAVTYALTAGGVGVPASTAFKTSWKAAGA